MHPLRPELLALIADLISNAAPSSDVRCRRIRQARSLKLWTTLLAQIPDSAGICLEKESQRWPVPLQRRFNSALRVRKQRRVPYTPFQGSAVSPRFKCMDTIFVLDLSAANRPFNPESSI
jgi:hypothetical protein